MEHLFRPAIVSLVIAFSCNAHASSATPRHVDDEDEQFTRDLEFYLPMDLLAELNGDVPSPKLSVSEQANVLVGAHQDMKPAVVLHMPVPQRWEPPCIVSDAGELTPSPLVAHLESIAKKEMLLNMARRAQEEKVRNQHIEAAFTTYIFKSLRSILRASLTRDGVDDQVTYRYLRDVIEQNLNLFRSAPTHLIKRLQSLVNKSHLPRNLKNHFCRFLMDYHVNYEGNFWKYHVMHEGVVFFCDYLPHGKKRFNNQPKFAQ